MSVSSEWITGTTDGNPCERDVAAAATVQLSSDTCAEGSTVGMRVSATQLRVVNCNCFPAVVHYCLTAGLCGST